MWNDDDRRGSTTQQNELEPPAIVRQLFARSGVSGEEGEVGEVLVDSLDAPEHDEPQGVRRVRRCFSDGRWHYALSDVVALFGTSTSPQCTWAAMKRELRTTGAVETLSACRRLMLPTSASRVERGTSSSTPGKARLFDCADQVTILSIVQSLPSPKAEPVRLWIVATTMQRIAGIRAEREAEREAEHEGRDQAVEAQAESTSPHEAHGLAALDDYGYMGLYNGEREADIRARKGLTPEQDLLDWMSADELEANSWCMQRTTELLRQIGRANFEVGKHLWYRAGKETRAKLKAMGRRMPEDEPLPAVNVRQVEAQLHPEPEPMPPLIEFLAFPEQDRANHPPKEE